MIDWNDPNNERQLLLACLNREQKGGWEEIASMLGPGFTANGVRQKFYKLKRESEAIVGKGNEGATPAPTPASTNKKTKKTPKPTPAKGKKRNANDLDNNDESDGNNPDNTPSKKGKKSPGDDDDMKMEAIVKADED